MAVFETQHIVDNLRGAREEWRQAHQRLNELEGQEFPSVQALIQVTEQLKGILFPMRLGSPELRREYEDHFVGHHLGQALNILLQQARIELQRAALLRGDQHDRQTIEEQAHKAIQAFADKLPDLRRTLDLDVVAAYQGDPAARNVDEVLLCYPGLLAMIHHRIAHTLTNLGLPLTARIIAELAHSQTGIDIHPGAQIDHSCFIDHGTGVVIGETAIIGKRVRIYQAVTLGAKRFSKDEKGLLLKGQARHPIVEDDVVIYAGATILGRVTLGAGSTIGGNVWITEDVPAGCSVTQANLLRNQPDCPETLR
ncbi:serine O-acetyltransferase EpsC [Alcaligenes faecalis]|uniref:serine O-acetyltransferase n=1 Tax=Alcaligenes faecalis TaxID=511 RepID=A0AB33D226_ALCFA|nr:serine O-acetyltransferase EpsC [Alcaligenes faecalis]ASR90298.1 serine acetyltransferase [Alcaligenes faecalis]